MSITLENDKIIILILLCIVGYFLILHNRVETYSDPLIDRIRLDLLRVDPRASLFTYSAANESFTEDKKHIFLCLKDEHGAYYPYNMLMYVALHELAHAISGVMDPRHVSREFRDNFEMLLRRAKELKLWDPEQPLITTYCGIDKKKK